MGKFPNLCLQYFKTITFVCEIYPEKVTSLNPDLQKNLVASLELGLTSLGVDSVFTLCCDFIQVLGCHMVRQKQQSSPIYEPLRPFLKLLLDLILSKTLTVSWCLIPLPPCTSSSVSSRTLTINWWNHLYKLRRMKETGPVFWKHSSYSLQTFPSPQSEYIVSGSEIVLTSSL